MTRLATDFIDFTNLYQPSNPIDVLAARIGADNPLADIKIIMEELGAAVEAFGDSLRLETLRTKEIFLGLSKGADAGEESIRQPAPLLNPLKQLAAEIAGSPFGIKQGLADAEQRLRNKVTQRQWEVHFAGKAGIFADKPGGPFDAYKK